MIGRPILKHQNDELYANLIDIRLIELKNQEREDESDQRKIAGQIQIQESVDNLARGREQRAGTDAGQVAANEFSRMVALNSLTDRKMQMALNAAKRHLEMISAIQELESHKK
jgi:hypothetical protein